jgi:hypothetical protein
MPLAAPSQHRIARVRFRICKRTSQSANHCSGESMYFTRSKYDHARRAARDEQRRREDAAPRLIQVVPTLTSLRLHFDDEQELGKPATLPFTRHIVVATGPALFSVPCLEPQCTGVHELTEVILSDLRRAQTRGAGVSACQGKVGDVACVRSLTYVYEATFST